jgi:histidyl-tRNA synthetase
VRGLDYYTRTLFEFQSGALEAAQNALGGGGRYDGLAEAIGGPPTPGMGWAAGVERMLMASTQAPPVEPPVDLYIAYEPGHKAAAFRLATDVRRAGHSARLELAGRSLKGQLKQASRSRARYVAIFGDEGLQLRDREGGEDKIVEPGTVMHHIRGRM